MPLPLIAAAGLSALGGYLSSRGADKQADAAARHQDLTENARQQSQQAISNPSIYNIGEFLFPGLLPNPTTPTPNRHGGLADAVLQRIEHKTGNTIGDMFRAGGGPVEGDQPYVVGEQGPEVIVPEEAGTVVPNDGTPPQGAPPQGGASELPPEILEALIPVIAQIVQAMLQGGGGGGGMPGMEPGMPSPEMGGAPQMGGAPPMGGMPEPRAQGGKVNPGQSYLVGEQGPEQVVPQQQGGPIGAQPPAGGFQHAGEAVTQHNLSFLNQPGQLSPILYQRDQEQANQALNAQAQGIQGGLTGQGVDPNSQMGQSLVASAALQHGEQRSEAARDYSLTQEMLGREDIAMATDQYLSFLNAIFGLAQGQAQAASGTGFAPATPINPYEPLARGASALGSNLGEYFRNRDSNSGDGDRPSEGPGPGVD